MRVGALRGDLSLLRAGLALGWTFGAGSLEELTRIALELENGIYRASSMALRDDRIEIALRNPPLRVGAFVSVAITWDGAEIPGASAWAATDREPVFRSLDSISRSAPLLLQTGEGSRYALRPPTPPTSGPHRIRVEWRSRAIPPLVWLEFEDRLRPEPP